MKSTDFSMDTTVLQAIERPQKSPSLAYQEGHGEAVRLPSTLPFIFDVLQFVSEQMLGRHGDAKK